MSSNHQFAATGLSAQRKIASYGHNLAEYSGSHVDEVQSSGNGEWGIGKKVRCTS
jgi:hypothetical protein